MPKLEKYDRLLSRCELRQTDARLRLIRLQLLPASTKRDTLIRQTEAQLKELGSHLESLHELRRLIVRRDLSG
jgi:hypothetical protein